MPGYHSRIPNCNYRIIGSIPILTFETNLKGPITKCIDQDLTEPTKLCPNRMDIVEEAIYYFRANVFLSKFEIKNELDRLLVYLTLYILECLKQINRSCVTKKQAQLTMINFSKNNVWNHDENDNKVLNFIYKKPNDSAEADYLKSYLQQIREETGKRICDVAFIDEKTKSKWWLCFAKRKFLNINLTI